MSHVMCVLMIMCHVLFLLRGRALQWPASPPGQCLGVDNWVKIPPINVGVCHKSTQSKQCPGRVWPVPADQSPATVRTDWPMVNRGLRVGCCHGAPTFLSRPSCGCQCLCPHMCRSGLLSKEQDQTKSAPISQLLERLNGNQKQKYSMTKHCIGTDHCLLFVLGLDHWWCRLWYYALCMYLSDCRIGCLL